MAEEEILNFIRYCQRKINTKGLSEERLLHYLKRIARIPMKGYYLTKTGIGKTVNSLSRNKGSVGEAADKLVRGWEKKDMRKLDSYAKSSSMNAQENEQKKQSSTLSKSHHNHQRASDHKNQPREHHRSCLKELSSNDYSGYKHISSVVQEGYPLSSSHKIHHTSLINHRSNGSNYSSSHRDKENKSEGEVKVEKERSSREKHASNDHSSSNNDKNKSREPTSSSTHALKRSDSNSACGSSKKNTLLKTILHEERKRKHHSSHPPSSSESSSNKKIKRSNQIEVFDSKSGISFADALGSVDTLSGSHVPKYKRSKTEEKKEEHDTGTKKVRHQSSSPYQNVGKNESTQSQEDVLSTLLSKRKFRPKVFSGAKVARHAVETSSYDSRMQDIWHNIRDLGYTRDIPYSVLKPALERANPQELISIESKYDYLIGETDELWQFHCTRDFEDKNPAETESWRDFYQRCTKEREQRFEVVTSQMKRNIQKAQPVRRAKLVDVDTSCSIRCNRLKAVKIKNGLKLKEEKGPSRGVVSSASTIVVQEASGAIASEVAHAPTMSASRKALSGKTKQKPGPLMLKSRRLFQSFQQRLK